MHRKATKNRQNMEEIWSLKNFTILDVYMVCFMRVLQSCSYKVAKIYKARCGLFYFNLLLKESGKRIWNCKTDWKLEGNIVDKEEIHRDATLYMNSPSNAWLISKLPMHERDAKDSRVKTIAENLKELNNEKNVQL